MLQPIQSSRFISIAPKTILLSFFFCLLAAPAWAERAATAGFEAHTNYIERVGAVWPGQSPFLVSAWVDRITDQFVPIYTLHTSTTSNAHARSLWVLGSGSDNRVRANSTTTLSNQVFADSTIGVTNNTWEHVAASFIASNSRAAYLDGGNKGTNTDSVSPNTPTRTRIGALPDGNTFFTGGVAEVSIWDTAGFTETERDNLVTELASGRNPLSINADAGQAWQGKLVAYPDLDFNSPTWLQDLSGNGHDFTEVGTLSAFSCVFRSKPATHSGVNRPPFRGNPATPR